MADIVKLLEVMAQQFAVTATKLAGSSPAQGIVHTPW